MHQHAHISPRSILFVCSRNAVRSPMAAALVRHYFGSRVVAESAGVEAGEIDPFAVAVMQELGIDIAQYRPKSFDVLSEMSFDLIVTLSPEAHHRALDLSESFATAVEYWPLQDPTLAVEFGHSRPMILDAYRAVREALTARITARLSAPPQGTL